MTTLRHCNQCGDLDCCNPICPDHKRMDVDEATAIIEKAIQEAFLNYSAEKAREQFVEQFERDLDKAVADGTYHSWKKRDDDHYDVFLIPKRPVEFINLNFMATA